MTFAEVIDFQAKNGTFQGVVPEEWRQGRTAYGGVTVAAAVRALRDKIPAERVLLQFNAQFVSVAGKDELELRTSVLAQGSNVTTGQVTGYSQGRPFLSLTAVFGAPRMSSTFGAAALEEKTRPETLPQFPYIKGITPQFTRKIQYRMLDSMLPFSGNEPRVSGFCRHLTGSGSSEEATIGLLDAWPPAVLPMLNRPSPASTISWSAHFYNPPEHHADDWWHYSAEPVRFQDGYATTTARLHSPDGRLVAWSEQLVAVFEKVGS